jgi:virulence-associated protein VagC
MKAAVRKAGVLVPKRFLNGATTVDIRRERGRVVILPLRGRQDPIRQLGRRPVRCGVSNGAVDHDAYLYDAP